MEKVKLYYNPFSRAAIVHWLLEELDASYELVPVSFSRKEHKTEAFLEVNPMGKVPAITYKGLHLTETSAICAYLADVFPKNQLAPALTDPMRAEYYRWLFFTAGCVEPAVYSKHLGWEIPEGKSGLVGYGSYEDTMKTLQWGLRRFPYLAGENFSAADIYLGAQIEWGLEFGTFEKLPIYTDYLAKIQNRDGYQRFKQQHRKLMAEQS